MHTRWKLLMTAAAALALSAPAAGFSQAAGAATATGAPFGDAEIIPLPQWRYEDVYAGGWSAEALLDTAVYGPTGENIGEVENIIVGPEGNIVSIIAEVGGFIDIGDTHVNVPWDEVAFGPGLDRVTIPVTEETVDQYAERVELAYLPLDAAGERVVPVEEDDWTDDLSTGPRAWRVDELLNDYVGLEGGVPYGWVNDLIFDTDGQLQAVVVTPRAAYGPGPFAYPWYGYGYGWSPVMRGYRLPYAEQDVAGLEPFEYGRLEGGFAEAD